MLTLLCSRKIIMNNNNDQIIKAPYSTYFLDIFLYKFQHGIICAFALSRCRKRNDRFSKVFQFPFRRKKCITSKYFVNNYFQKAFFVNHNIFITISKQNNMSKIRN